MTLSVYYDLILIYSIINSPIVRIIYREATKMSNIFKGKIEFYYQIIFQKGEQKTLVVNVDTRQSVFVANEILDILFEAEKENLSAEKLIECAEFDDDKEYLRNVLNKLNENHVFVDSMPPLTSKRIGISIDLTNRCNLACRHCCVSANDDLSGELSTDELKTIIRRVCDFDPRSISISGGEPLVRKDFQELIIYLRERFKKPVDILTNATLIDEDMAPFIAENFNSVSVSIDGCDEESCSIIRGEGVFEKTIAGIKRLQNAGMKDITASMTMCQENEKYRLKYVDLCKSLGIAHVFRHLCPSERNDSSDSPLHYLMPDEPMTDEKFSEYRKKYKEKGLHKIQPETFSCQGARREFQIDFKGRLFPCPAVMEDEFYMGNMLEQEDYSDFILGGKYKESNGYKNFIAHMPFNTEGCKDCNKNLICFSCVRDLIDMKKLGTLQYHCRDYSRIYDMYWED